MIDANFLLTKFQCFISRQVMVIKKIIISCSQDIAIDCGKALHMHSNMKSLFSCNLAACKLERARKAQQRRVWWSKWGYTCLQTPSFWKILFPTIRVPDWCLWIEILSKSLEWFREEFVHIEFVFHLWSMQWEMWGKLLRNDHETIRKVETWGFTLG